MSKLTLAPFGNYDELAVFADARPIFDFDGAITVMIRLSNFALEFRGIAATRYLSRNAALDEWEGVHGDDFRIRAADENQSLIDVLRAVRDESQAWAQAWTRAVNQMNTVLHAEAVEDLERRIAQKVEERNIAGDIFFGAKDAVIGTDTAYDRVPKPKEVKEPQIETLDLYGTDGDKYTIWERALGQTDGEIDSTRVTYDSAPFAVYSRDDDNVSLSYSAQVPAKAS